MAIKKFKPTSPALRQMTVLVSDEITTNQPEKSLLVSLKKNSGRNAHGKITVRHRGGGNRRKYRIIDFKRNKDGIPAKVATVEYDPNRTANIALLNYADGEKRYILAPVGIKVGDTLMSGPQADIKPGNALALKNMPVGTVIHNIELKPGKGAQLVRSAGVSAQLMAKEGTKALLRLHPTIRDNVTIYSNSSVLGGETVIGENTIIGGNTFITESIPANTKVSAKSPELVIKKPRSAVEATNVWDWEN